MWIFTTYGFLSVVQHNALLDHFQIKSRVRDPLSELWPDHEIEVIDWADYRFRITIEKSEALPTLIEVMGSVDYTSFKDACGCDSKYHLALTKIWNIMYSFQREMES
jgi:hypothetical protein|tara:strand:+ start:739 stop:1059 length:321 start_codon:yes stop_codon:yes gene_type:complete